MCFGSATRSLFDVSHHRHHSTSARATAPARKRFGQHFLRDAEVVQAIVAAVAPAPDDRVVEIGPGRGVLTQALLSANATHSGLPHLAAIEIDRDLAARLRQTFGTRLHLIEADALQVDLCQLRQHWPWPDATTAAAPDVPDTEAPCDKAPRLRLVGNLPYNISSPLMLAFLQQSHCLRDLHVMLQTEVGMRLSATCGSSSYGRLGILIQACFAVQPLFDVPPEAFVPPPKVRSTVLRLTPLPDPHLPHEALTALSAVTRVAFSQRRKRLRHTLQPWLNAQGIQTDLDFQQRAEELPPQTFYALARLCQTNLETPVSVEKHHIDDDAHDLL